MSRSISTEVLIGVKFNPSILRKTVKEKSCKHINPENVKFCGECGKPIYTEKQVSIFSYEVQDKLYDNNKGEVYLTGTYPKEDEYIGIKISYLSDKWETEVDMSNLEEKTNKLLEFFKKNNLDVKKEDIKIYHLLTIN